MTVTVFVVSVWILIIVVLVYFYGYWNRRWQRSIEVIWDRVAAEDLNGAIEALKLAQEAVKKLKPSDPRRLMVLLERARLQRLSSDLDGASETLCEVSVNCVGTRSHTNTKCRMLGEWAAVEWARDNTEDAKKFVEAMIFESREAYGPRSKEGALWLNQAARMYLDAGCIDEGRQAYEEAELIIKGG